MNPLALIALVAVASLASGCGSLSDWQWKRVTVASILAQSQGVAEELDREARQKELEEGRTPASRPMPVFQQPLRAVRVSSEFGNRGGRRHEGVDFRAAEGTPVYAAEKGAVVFAGPGVRGYGILVVLRHVGGYSTLYAHNSVLRVQVGDRVNKGDCIAYSGSTGRVTGPHLHFEIREGVHPVSPLDKIFPRRQRKPAASVTRSPQE